ncbi:MAG: NUDIX domain-containing protein [Halobacteria archaeon]|nr:NUDIX domain-containing protein [Halobacteria archaeon]
MGAGVVPFCVSDGEVRFLFHKTFSGRRAGCLVDFGGGAEPGESYRQTAMREFVEETETMFFAENPAQVSRSRQRIESQLALVGALFDRTLDRHPDWWCSRRGGQRDWKTFFIEFEYRDVAAMNREWQADDGARFTRRRELVWVPAATLCSYYKSSPERLWKRVRQLQGAVKTIQSIVSYTQTRQ